MRVEGQLKAATLEPSLWNSRVTSHIEKSLRELSLQPGVLIFNVTHTNIKRFQKSCLSLSSTCLPVVALGTDAHSRAPRESRPAGIHHLLVQTYP